MAIGFELTVVDLQFVEKEGPFCDFNRLKKKPAHLAVFLHYLISNSDPLPLVRNFHIHCIYVRYINIFNSKLFCVGSNLDASHINSCHWRLYVDQ